MFAEPQTVTVNAVPESLPRVAFGERRGVFQDLDAGIVLTISHTSGKGRRRTTVRLDFNKTAADPLLDGVSKQYSMSTLQIIDTPIVGFDSAEVEANAKALADWVVATGNLSKAVNGES